MTSLQVLEPSAGWGNIVRGVLLFGAKKKLNIVMDMVEFEEDNRKELQKVANTIPTACYLAKEKNFLNMFRPKDMIIFL